MSGKYGEFVATPAACSALDDWQFQPDDVTLVVDTMAERRELPGRYTMSDLRHLL